MLINRVYFFSYALGLSMCGSTRNGGMEFTPPSQNKAKIQIKFIKITMLSTEIGFGPHWHSDLSQKPHSPLRFFFLNPRMSCKSIEACPFSLCASTTVFHAARECSNRRFLVLFYNHGL